MACKTCGSPSVRFGQCGLCASEYESGHHQDCRFDNHGDGDCNCPELIRQETSTFIKRSSNYVTGHGSYIQDWVVGAGGSRRQVFKFMMSVSEPVAKFMVQEAMHTNCAGFPVDRYGVSTWGEQGEKHVEREEVRFRRDPAFWMLPGNKDFIVLNNGVDHPERMTVLYNHDGKYQVWSAAVCDVREYMIRNQHNQREALKLLVFGTTELPPAPREAVRKYTDEFIAMAVEVEGRENRVGVLKWMRDNYLGAGVFSLHDGVEALNHWLARNPAR